MASLFKRNRPETIPDGSLITEGPDGRIARWKDAKGRSQQAPLNKAGTKVMLPPLKDDPWCIAYDDENGVRRVATAYRDKESSEAMGRRLELEVAQRREGLVDPSRQYANTPISELLDEWIAGMKAARASQMKMHVQRIVTATGASRLQGLDTPRIEKFLKQLRDAGEIGDVTEDEYRASVRAFAKWAVENRRIGFNPVATLKRVKRSHATHRHERRALSLDDLGKLLAAAEERPMRELLTIRHGPKRGELGAVVRPEVMERAKHVGRVRKLVYLLAFWARLRRKEIRTLTWENVRFDAKPYRIQLRRHRTKAKRADSVPIHLQLEEALRSFWHECIDPASPVIDRMPGMRTMKADLKAAGIDYEVDGLFADLHSLGKSFVTACEVHGVGQRATQEMARHADPRMTAGTYTDRKLLPLAAELLKVPAIPTPTADAPATIPLRATGTEGAGPASEVERAAPAQRNSDVTLHFMAAGVTSRAGGQDDNGEVRASAQIERSSRFGIKRHDPAPCGTGSLSEAGEGGRTLDIHVGNVTLYH
jgi:integrase/recombinase XerC